MQVSPVRVWVLASEFNSAILDIVVACGRGSVVERLLAKEKVTGSNPVARSGYAAGFRACRAVFGDVAKW